MWAEAVATQYQRDAGSQSSLGQHERSRQPRHERPAWPDGALVIVRDPQNPNTSSVAGVASNICGDGGQSVGPAVTIDTVHNTGAATCSGSRRQPG